MNAINNLMKKSILQIFIAVPILGSLIILSAAFGGLSVAEDASVDQNQQMDFKPQQTQVPAAGDVFDQTISLSLKDIDVVESLKFLANKAGLNIITTKAVGGRVTLNVENASLRDVFDIMLRSNGLAYAKKGSIYNVMSEAEYKALYGKNFFDTRQVKVFHLQYTIPEQAFTMVDALKSEIGRVVVDAESGNVMVMDTPEKLEVIGKTLQEYESQNTVEVFTLKYAKAKEVEEILKTQLDAKKVGSIKADERNNQIIIQTLPNRMREMEKLIMRLDRQTKEVLIDTKIVKIRLADQYDKGIEWEGLLNMGNKWGNSYLGTYPISAVQPSTASWRSRMEVLSDMGANGVGSFPFSGTTSNFSASQPVAPGQALHYGIIADDNDFDIFAKYLQTLGQTKVLSNPKIVVVNNQEAKIHVGERQAYVTTTTTSGQSTSTVAEEVTFVDVGIQLAVTANINDDGYITMKVKPEISSVTSTLTTPTGNKIPIIDTSLTETTVMMKDGTTLVIGGLRKEEKTLSSEGVPGLSKIPFIGFVFKSETSETEKTETLVMMTPHIISGNTLTRSDDRLFEDKPGKEYRDYQSMVPDKEISGPEVPPEIEPKSYRGYSIPGEDEGGFRIKEMRYEPYVR